MDHAQDAQIASAARSCQQRTEQMIQQCSSITFPKSANGTDVVSKKKHKRSEDSENHITSKRVKLAIEAENKLAADSSTSNGLRRVPVTKDPSGLFQIDSNPDDVDVLIEQAEKLQEAQRKKQAKQEAKQKRKHQPEAEEVDVSLEVEELDHEPSTSKRKKAKHAETVQEPASDAEDYNQEFERKVELRLKEKEEDRKKKANKKRKRESEASVAEAEATEESEVKQPAAKKGKGKPAAAKAVEPTKSPKASKRGKKRNSKDATTAQDSSQQKPKKKKRKKST